MNAPISRLIEKTVMPLAGGERLCFGASHGERPSLSTRTLVVLTACATAAEAEGLAKALVERRLAACVNAVANVVSTFRWQGAVQSERESLLVIKTTEARLAAVEAVIHERSTYELPEMIAIEVAGGSARYLDWVQSAVADD
jgi:periplasmic divalent cation tolerance protein